MDDLDKELFSSTLRKKSLSSILTSTQRNDLDFDEEDPLGDILSSSGENTPVHSSSKQSISKDTQGLPRQNSKSKLIADLFGLNEQEEVKSSSNAQPTMPVNTKQVSKTESPGDWLGLKAEQENINLEKNSNVQVDHLNVTIPEIPNSPLKINLKKNDFVSSTDPKEGSKIELFPKTPFASSVYEEAITKLPSNRKSGGTIQDSKKQSSILSSFMSDFDAKPNPSVQSSVNKSRDSESRPDNGKMVYMPSVNREPRRSVRRRSDLVDPLGLFSANPPESDSSITVGPQDTKREVEPPTTAKSNHTLSSDQLVPPWLGGVTSGPSDSTPSFTHQTATVTKSSSTEEPIPPTQNDEVILGGLANLENQASEAATQQQKNLITALALKRQEDVLLKMQSQQASLLSQHEQQLGALVQRQVQRQQQMLRQQEQIQSHIQALLIQPPAIPPITLPSALWKIEEGSNFNSDSHHIIEATMSQNREDMNIMSELKEKIQRLENENHNLRSLLESEKQRYENQLADIENFYRKQLAIQDDTMLKQEKRLLSEKDAAEKETLSRISQLKEEHNAATQQQVQRMAQLHGEWLADLQRLGEFHQQAVEMLRSEQTSAIEHWKNLQASEIAAVQDAGSNTRLLQEAVKKLQESTATFLELKDEMKKESQAQISAKQEMLLKQEVQLNGLKEVLEKQASSLDAERTCLMTMSREMESRLLRQQQDLDTEKNRFEIREKAWEKEKLGVIEILTQEKKQLEKLQSVTQAELSELGERKLALVADVARLEATLHIQNTNATRNSQHAEQMVAEARSTLEAAQEAGKEVQREREEIMASKQNLSAEQNRLSNLEREIQARERRVEEEKMKAKAFKEEGRDALDEARRLERERTEHASDLAQRLLHLKEREDHLAEEKLAVTMEWKRLQESRDRAISCSLCGQGATTTLSTSHGSQNFVDPVPIIMKLEAEQGLDFLTLDHPNYNLSFLESISQ